MNNPSRTGSRAGFTLIEILAAMVIMSLIMLVLGNIFSVSQKTMTHGQEMVDQTAQGRAVVDFMAREIADAVIDQDMGFVLESDHQDFSSGGADIPSPDRLTFVSMSRKPDAPGKRAFRQVRYYIKPDVTSPGTDTNLDFERPGLMRVTKVDNFDYAEIRDGDMDNTGADLLMDFVRTLEIWVYADPDTTNTDHRELAAIADYAYPNTDDDGPPVYVEIYVDMLTETDARLVHEGVRTLTEVPVRRYFRRVYLHNVIPEMLAVPK